VLVALGFVAGIIVLVFGVLQLVSARSAEAGHGTAGYFVAASCPRSIVEIRLVSTRTAGSAVEAIGQPESWRG
jgi:hypothetical protein